MNWRPISTAPRDTKPKLLKTDYPKARYKVLVGVWVSRYDCWQSAPGGWPIKPQWWADVSELDEFLGRDIQG